MGTQLRRSAVIVVLASVTLAGATTVLGREASNHRTSAPLAIVPAVSSEPSDTPSSSDEGIGDPFETIAPSPSDAASGDPSTDPSVPASEGPSASATGGPSVEPSPSSPEPSSSWVADGRLVATFAPSGSEGHRAGGTITVTATQGETTLEVRSATTDASGSARFQGLPRGVDGATAVTWHLQAALSVEYQSGSCTVTAAWTAQLTMQAPATPVQVSTWDEEAGSSALECPSAAATPSEGIDPVPSEAVSPTPSSSGDGGPRPTTEPTAGATPPFTGDAARGTGPGGATPPATDLVAADALSGRSPALTPALALLAIFTLVLVLAGRPVRARVAQRRRPR